MLENKRSFSLKAGGILSGFVVGVVIGIVLFAGIGDPIINDNDFRSWELVAEWTPVSPVYAEADPGAGNSGILEIFYVNHSAGNDYASENTSATLETWCDTSGLGYCNADDSDTELAYDTAFDIVVRVRCNDDAKRDSTWWDTDVRVRMTSADLSIAGDTEMTRSITANNSDYTFLYLNFYLDGGGSGYTLTKGESNEITSIKFEIYK